MEVLNDLIGKKVTVHSQLGSGEKQDIGILEKAEGHWIKLQKSGGEIMYFSIYQIRVVKPFDIV